QAEIQEAAKRGAQMIELRLDYLTKAPDFKRLLTVKPCPMIATVRRQEDGGRWAGTAAARQMLLPQAVVAGYGAVALEPYVATVRPSHAPRPPTPPSTSNERYLSPSPISAK